MIENIQPSANEIFTPIIKTRDWSTEACKIKYFNDYVFYGLKENILKRVTVNGVWQLMEIQKVYLS